MTVYSTYYNSPVGRIFLVEKDAALLGLWIDGQKYFLGSLKEELTQKDDSPILLQTKLWLERYFSGQKPSICELPLAPIGSNFQKSVWKILCEIPYGEVTTYGAISKRIAAMTNKKMSAQAVGGAVAHNPISIIIPCHRVVGANGNLTGYAGGIQKKIQLLEHEGLDMSRFQLPAQRKLS